MVLLSRFEGSRVGFSFCSKYPEVRNRGRLIKRCPANAGLKESKMEDKSKLYVGNLPYSVTDESLKETFGAAGEVTEAKVITDKFSGRSKGFGFVTMKDEKAAQKAVEELNGKEIDGRALKVNVARPMRER